MNVVSIAVMALVTVVEGGEAEVSGSPSDGVPAQHPVAQEDFIVPIAKDIRFGFSANIGSYRRSQDAGEGTDGDFIEHGLWTSYVAALSGPGRVLSGRAEWRIEVGLLVSQADVSNPNDSTGRLRTASLDLGIGPAWRIMESDTSRLEVELMPFAGFGYSRYENDYSVVFSGFRGENTTNASGFAVEYGIKANLMWCWSNGWGAALHAGLVQRASRLDGDSTTRWDTSSVVRDGYTSDDTLTGARFGLFVARRF